MNRRGFLKLLAGAAAFTLSAPVIRLIPGAPTLAERARAYNATEAQCVMREILDEGIRAQFEEESLFFKMFPDNTTTFVADGGVRWLDKEYVAEDYSPSNDPAFFHDRDGFSGLGLQLRS